MIVPILQYSILAVLIVFYLLVARCGYGIRKERSNRFFVWFEVMFLVLKGLWYNFEYNRRHWKPQNLKFPGCSLNKPILAKSLTLFFVRFWSPTQKKILSWWSEKPFTWMDSYCVLRDEVLNKRWHLTSLWKTKIIFSASKRNVGSEKRRFGLLIVECS